MKEKLHYRWCATTRKWWLQHPAGLSITAIHMWIRQQLNLGAPYYLPNK